MQFQKFGLSPALLKNVLALGYTIPTPVQERAIPAVKTGRDLIATAQTGTGKTAAFLLPVLDQLLVPGARGPRALVLTPTRELATQIHGVFRGLANGTGLRACIIIGGAPMGPQLQTLRAGVDLVVATPGRLLAHLRDNGISMPNVSTLILDEADQMFDLGFFPDVKKIIAKLPGRKQTLLFSATMPPEVAVLSRTILNNPETVTCGTEGTSPVSIRQLAFPVPASRKAALLQHLLEHLENPSVLIFTKTRHGAKQLTRRLFDAGHEVEELHGDRSPAQRERAMRGFRNRAFPILVATSIAARGIDVRHVTHVINYDVPLAPEEYVHRIGRTGRAGDEGDALMLVTPEERGALHRIERRLGKQIPTQRVDDFDYGTTKEPPTPRKKTGRPVAVAAVPAGKKPRRGQGRR